MAPAAIGVYAGILAALWHGGKIARAVRFASRGIYTELAGEDFDVKREVEIVQGRNRASDARWLPRRVNRQVIPRLPTPQRGVDLGFERSSRSCPEIARAIWATSKKGERYWRDGHSVNRRS